MFGVIHTPEGVWILGKDQGLNSMLRDIEKKYNIALKELAEEITYQIENSYETVIDKFYEDYSPRYYDRTYSTYIGSDHYDDMFNFQQLGDTYLAGINVSSSNIPGSPYRADTDWVFDRTFYGGIHGINRTDKIRMNKTRGRGYEKDLINITTIKNMHPAPKVLMDKEFKRITKKSNMDKLFNQAMNKALG